MTIRGQIVERHFTLERGSGDGVERVYPASLSSEQPVRRMFGTEILSHAEGAVNFDRAGRGLPLLFNHDMDAPIGRVSDIRVDGTKLRGLLRFSPNSERGPRVQADVDAGFLGDVSIRYSIDEYETVTDDRGNDTITVTRWTPLEASIVTVPADSSVGIGRSISKEQQTMTTETTGAKPDSGGDGQVNVVAFQAARAAAAAEGAAAGVAQERERIAALDEVFAKFASRGEDVAALEAECVRAGSTPDQARIALLELISGTPNATPSGTRKAPDDEGRAAGTRQARIEAGRDGGEKFAEGLQRAIEVKAKMITGKDAEREHAENEYTGMTLVEMIRAYGNRLGIRTNFSTASQMVGHVLMEGRRAAAYMTTTDFAGIVANVASKSLLSGWEENPATWQQWCRVGSVNDFRRVNRTGIAGADILDAVPQNVEYQYGDNADRTEYLTAAAYGKLFAISRAAILADDVGAFSTIPRRMGRAASMTVNKTVYDSLKGAAGVGPTLNQDSVALFHAATHSNYVTSGAAPSVATLNAARAAMARQSDPNNGLPLNIRPKYLIVPVSLETTAKVLIASEKDPLGTASATGGATTPNPYYNALTVIAEPYLDSFSSYKGTTGWYLAGDQNMHDTYEVAFVGGQSTPYLESRDGWSVDGIEYKVRIEFGVAALDYRALYYNDGD